MTIMGTSASVQKAKARRFSKNDVTLASLEPGDLVKFRRSAYCHWAVYIGDDQVVHVAEQDQDGRPPDKSLVRATLELSKVQISIQNFWAVAKSDKALKANDRDTDWSPLPGDEIVERATSYLGEVRYNLLTSNCEHFAKWCRYDRYQSDQVERLHIYKSDVLRKAVLAAVDTATSTLHKATNKVKGQISLKLLHRPGKKGGAVGSISPERTEHGETHESQWSVSNPTDDHGVREIMKHSEPTLELSPSNVTCRVNSLKAT